MTTAQRVITSAGDKTSHYTGVGYQYFFTNDPSHGRICKMQVAKTLLETFEKAKGKINSLGMPHLQVLDQGNGWWLICADQMNYDSVVSDFIAKFNRWALKRAASGGNVIATASNAATNKARYTIEVRANHNGRAHHPEQRLSSAQPVPAEEGTLQELANKLNEKFGHLRKK